MNRMAEKLRASVKKSLNEENFMAADHLATASCIFAREMDCVEGKPPNTQSSARDTRPPQLFPVELHHGGSSTTPPNKSLDASGGSAFLNLIRPAMLD